jgi:RNA polymerase sigma-70 factor, ECF subfamily
VRCEVAREALSARLDGERQHVPSRRVEAHLESCRDCRAWLSGAAEQARRLDAVRVGPGPDLAAKIMATAGVEPTGRPGRWWRWAVSQSRRWGLIAVGVLQLAVAIAQLGGIDFGMASASEHGPTTGAHLMHESTAWLLALGVGMVAAGIWTLAAAGVATVLGVYCAVLVGYVIADAWSGQVTAARVASHAPILLGLVFALLVVRERAEAGKFRGTDTRSSEDLVLPAGARRGRRRGHLWPANRSAA